MARKRKQRAVETVAPNAACNANMTIATGFGTVLSPELATWTGRATGPPNVPSVFSSMA